MTEQRTDPGVHQPGKLWTRDFTIITVGSVVSMFGNALSGFAISLLVLDFTKSTFLYALFIMAYTLPQLIMPILSGAVLDRYSRKKTIYSLDFISSALFAFAALIFHFRLFSYPMLLLFSLLIGTVNSVYLVAYESFYPLLITEGNFSKAYSVSSVLETLSSVMIPISALIYNRIGIAPLFAVNALSFFTAAVMETQIRTNEEYIEKRDTDSLKMNKSRIILSDIREGMQYLYSEKGLLAIAVYFAFSSMTGGASSTITLPYFKSTFLNGEYVYMLVWGMMIVGRTIGGMLHYRIRIPTEYKYAIALTVYLLLSVLEGTYLFFPIPIMMLFCLISGLGGVTSYTIRISATQSYVPDEKKGRFNGVFNMINTAGSLLGELVAGILCLILSPRIVLISCMLINGIAAAVLIGGNHTHVAAIYNRQQ